MRRIKEVLRLHFELKRNKRQIALSIGISPTTVGGYVDRAAAAGLSYPLPPEMDDVALERLMFPPPPPVTLVRAEPDWPAVYTAMKHKGMTLTLAWQEYKSIHPDGYQLSWFCAAWRQYVGRLGVTLRQQHQAGECYVDYCGPTAPVIDAATGEIRHAQIFVGVLGASNYTYAEATWSQTIPDWIGAHSRMFTFFGGVPDMLVPDNLKSGVKRASYYDPELNPTYREFAAYYGVAVLPARPRKPRDKAKVEVAVQIVERWILARLRNRQFFTLAELNAAIAPLLDDMNRRPFRKLPGCRRALFDQVEVSALKPLPAIAYEFAEWKYARVNIDCHIEVDGHYYSVPYRLLRQQIDVRMTAHIVEVFHRGKRVASHVRSHARGRQSTVTEHLPAQRQQYLDWTPDRLIRWAQRIGEATGIVIERMIAARKHPAQAYRSCLGILRLGKAYSDARLECACRRALSFNAMSYRSIESMLKTGMDQKPLPAATPTQVSLPLHENVRGPAYYH